MTIILCLSVWHNSINIDMINQQDNQRALKSDVYYLLLHLQLLLLSGTVTLHCTMYFCCGVVFLGIFTLILVSFAPQTSNSDQYWNWSNPFAWVICSQLPCQTKHETPRLILFLLSLFSDFGERQKLYYFKDAKQCWDWAFLTQFSKKYTKFWLLFERNSIT